MCDIKHQDASCQYVLSGQDDSVGGSVCHPRTDRLLKMLLFDIRIVTFRSSFAHFHALPGVSFQILLDFSSGKASISHR